MGRQEGGGGQGKSMKAETPSVVAVEHRSNEGAPSIDSAPTSCDDSNYLMIFPTSLFIARITHHDSF